MNELPISDSPRTAVPQVPIEDVTQGTSSIYRLFEAFIGLRERNERQHKLFEQSLAKARDVLQASFNAFAADTQRAYQQLRQEVHGEKRLSQALLNELLEIGFDMEQIASARPPIDLPGREGEAARRWADAVEVQHRKVGAALIRHGVQRYDAVVGTPYNPALHERVGSKRIEGLEALRIAEQVQHGFASQQPEFVLRRPKVFVTE
jgi:molecular chaperone GrpE (heat shock protein)